MTARAVVALDVGGTKLAAATAVPGEAGWSATARAPTPATGAEALTALLALADSLGSDQIGGVGVSFGGHVDARTGTARRSVHVPGWEDVPLAALLGERFGAPVRIANDGNAGALGEWDAAARPRDPVCYVTVSTGVGGGVVVDGELVAGADGLAAEVGHLLVEPGGAACGCGRRGCVETVASGPAIARRAGTASAEAAVAAAERGDERARRALADAAHALATAVAALVAVVNPAFVAIGGGVANAGPLLWDPLEDELAATAWPEVTTRVGRAASDDAPLVGARVLAERAMIHAANERAKES
ncbi:MAG TPA: ROK family protein [Gaiellaceae bacterium]|nr:ROK family protein [Gaiellaceae bacterium]